MSWPNLNFSGKDSFFNEDGGKSYVLSGRTSFRGCVKTRLLPIWPKGVNTKEDVEMAIEYGVDGVVISNHGGWQLDGVPAAIDALRECEPVTRRKIQIALEGGIRRGSGTFKALALGAQHCFVGRVPLWGLAYNDQNGVELSMKTTMALAGVVGQLQIYDEVIFLCFKPTGHLPVCEKV
ncbi:FMN-dependent dehydrogenase-domain-containing protein [Aspergillus pseudonomiae]|uniref:FMN-dependent dehydrogenase-domain-containing protein n=1 Tax=Aspergillus pseudonomiae TaxID=1506151 RepID=A0A5N6IF66_9EURO|nr:FMN-dependent dehydrogenase-domain-containing protein [Aspergillus pseudonomiae]KAB8263693.1 FMN-dependent dehydrogenase-domain-containing protein [Aspergillus pseudonomiae]KAE8408560.1 FMN-dependent dehydrogenase-domain-containing protein [Aspergillus pseudonomiae]